MPLINILLGLVCIVLIVLGIIYIPPKVWFMIVAGGGFIWWLVYLAIKIKNEV